MTLSDLKACVLKAGKMGGMLNLILIAARAIAAILITMSHVTQDILNWIGTLRFRTGSTSGPSHPDDHPGGPWRPSRSRSFAFPSSSHYHLPWVNGIWFGVITVIIAELAIIFRRRMNLFVLQEMSKGRRRRCGRRSCPFSRSWPSFWCSFCLPSPEPLARDDQSEDDGLPPNQRRNCHEKRIVYHCLCCSSAACLSCRNLRCAGDHPFQRFVPGHNFMTKQCVEWAKLVDQNSGGELKVQIFDSAQLYKDNELIKAIQTGAVDAGIMAVRSWGRSSSQP
jgi:hypothetical protein